MTNSTSNGQGPDSSQNVEAIFRLSLPFYTGPVKGSESTRKPASYDLHLSKDLLLKKTVFCHNLPEELGMAAKNALEEATLPPSGHGSSCKLASAIESKIQEYALDNNRSLTEHNVVAAYRHNVFSNIASIASILQFPSSSWNTQFLEMPISDSAHLSADSGRGKRSNYAIADAILRIDPDKHDSAMSAHSRILEDMKITAKYFERIVPFEFKSLSSGSYHTMLGILGHTLQEIFPWQRCSSEYCAYEDGPKLGREPITGDPQGFDAMISAVNLIISDWDGKTKEAYDAMSNKDRTKYTGHGKDMLQQLWAEMVKCDATYAVLHAGNYELLFFRNRASQTLYISDVVEPHSVGQGTAGGPGYYQIHIGLYISAIRDATNRARQLEDFGGGDVLPDMWTRPYDLNVGKFKPTRTPKPKFHDVINKYMELCLGTTKKGSGNVTYKSNRPYHRIRSPVNGEEKFFYLETSDGTDSNEVIGTLYADGHSYASWPVVIKVATGQKNTQQLMKEYRNHELLSSLPGQNIMIPKTYGFFTLAINNSKAVHAILLLEYVGKPVERLNYLTAHQRFVIRQTLRLIHRNRFIYGALSRHKIYVDVGPGSQLRHKNGGKVGLAWLTDFSKVKRIKKPGERRKERKKFKKLLENDEDANPPPPLYPIEIGPVSSDVEDAKLTFDELTHWMSQEPWLQTARCAKKPEADDEFLLGTWLVVKFSSREHVIEFRSKWNERPLEFSEIHCYDTFFNQESRESSQAYSPPHFPSSGVDSAESSQASSGMAIDS